MAPPSATDTNEIVDSGASAPSNSHDGVGTATHEPGLTKKQAEKAEVSMPKFPGMSMNFENKYEEREYQKGRLVLAFRIFAKLGFDEGVAGHITLRVSSDSQSISLVGKCWGRRGVWRGRTWLTESRTLLNQQVFGSIPLESHGHS
jgi:hypothetical protein